MARWSLNNPMPGHIPHVGRTRLGTSFFGGRLYGTTLTCSCGWKPRDEPGDPKVTNQAPSRGGRSIANDRYRMHMGDVAAREPTENEAKAE